jgi:small subunit ribosomal protein S17
MAENASAEEKNPETTPADARSRNRRKVRFGTVVSDKMDKTVVVAIEDVRPHRLYGKRVRRTSKLKAHDELGAGVGDTVRLGETRPLSATKRWRVVEVIQKAK